MRRLTKSLLALLALCLLVAPAAAQESVVRVGMVADGSWERDAEFQLTLEEEIRRLTQHDFDVRFAAEKRSAADWTPAGVEQAIEGLLTDPEVDLLITIGPLSAHNLAGRESLPKPVVAAFALDPTLQGLPLSEGTSGRANFNYIVYGSGTSQKLHTFAEVAPFKSLAILVSEHYLKDDPTVAERLTATAQTVGAVALVVPVGDSPADAAAGIAAETDAVFVGPLFHWTTAQVRDLAGLLVDRKLPSFSSVGRQEVAAGILAGVTLEKDLERLVRRTALNVQSILLGTDAGQLPVTFPATERLTINMQTARAIGSSPKWSVLSEAEVLHELDDASGRMLSLSQTVREARNVNLDLAAADRKVAAGEQSVKEARAGLLPQVSVSAGAFGVDSDRAALSFGNLGKGNLSAGAQVSQLIYSERVKAGYDAEKKVQVVREEERQQLRLDVIQEAAVAYLNLLQTKTFVRIERENLDLSRSNLELAIAREKSGRSSAADVYRWKNQIANNRRSLVEATAILNLAQIEVNRILDRPLEERFVTTEATLDDEGLRTSFLKLGPYIDNPLSFEVFRQFMVTEGLSASPELRQLVAAIGAQERVLKANRRRFYVPDIGASANVTQYKRYGTGVPDFGDIDFTIPSIDNLNWEVGVQATLPLTEGGGRRAAVREAREEVARLEIERDATQNRVDQRIRSAVHQAGASFVSIELAQEAAAAARSNLDLVIDSYSRGGANVITLLDAQATARVAEQVAANAIYKHLLDLMHVQRAVGRFDYFSSDEEQEQWLDRLNTYFIQVGRPVG
jgi:outer membrane protein